MPRKQCTLIKTYMYTKSKYVHHYVRTFENKESRASLTSSSLNFPAIAHSTHCWKASSVACELGSLHDISFNCMRHTIYTCVSNMHAWHIYMYGSMEAWLQLNHSHVFSIHGYLLHCMLHDLTLILWKLRTEVRTYTTPGAHNDVEARKNRSTQWPYKRFNSENFLMVVVLLLLAFPYMSGLAKV